MELDPEIGPDSTPTQANKSQSIHIDQSDDDACGKLWDVYLAEAQRYDEGLVKSWKEDMDVTLVFSGLYSAVLTAFVIENYRNLKADPTETSAALLQQILVQLADGGNSSNNGPSVNSEFAVSSVALASNILWFISLTLALMCAFLATFVQQWTRQFLHRTTILRSSTARARLFSFLYFGLRDCHMHTVVDIIPSLLHSSIFCFFAGLVAFLHDVNRVVTWLIAAALILITLVYWIFTVLPVWKLNSSYQTPLSPLVWRFWRSYRDTLHRVTNYFQSKPVLPTAAAESLPKLNYPEQTQPHRLTDAKVLASTQNREDRESKSVAWAMRSLNDDHEFLPFLESVPDVIFGPNGLRTTNFHLLRPLLETKDPGMDIISRAISLMANAENPWFGAKHRQRCRTACPRALWALAHMLLRHPEEFSLQKAGKVSWFPLYIVDALKQALANDIMDKSYGASAIALCALTGTQERHITSTSRSLEGTMKDDIDDIPLPTYSVDLFINYVQGALHTLPYEFELTCSLISLYHPLKVSPIIDDMCHRLKTADNSSVAEAKFPDFDRVFAVLLMKGDLIEAEKSLRYISMRIDMGGWTTTAGLWSTRSQPRISRLHQVATAGPLNDLHCDVLKESLFCLTPEWTRTRYISLGYRETLQLLHSRKGCPDWSPSTASLYYMTLILGLKPCPGPEPRPLDQELFTIVLDILPKIYSRTPGNREDHPAETQSNVNEVLSQRLLQLICQVLQQLDTTEYPKALAARDILEYLHHLDLRPVLSESITPEIAADLARFTKAQSERWRGQVSYREGDARQEMVILVWQLWIPFLERSDPAISATLPVLREAADIIERFEIAKLTYKGVWEDPFEKDWKPRRGAFRPFDYGRVDMKNLIARLKPLMRPRSR